MNGSGLAISAAIARDAGYAVRILRKNPTFSATAILTLALVIGANTAVFSVVDAVLFRPLPYPAVERLAELVTVVRGKGLVDEMTSQNGTTYETFRDEVKSIEWGVFSEMAGGVSLAGDQAAVYVRQQRVSAGFFRVLGVAPAAGRTFVEEEDRPGGAPVVVLSDGLWRRAFNADRSILGRTVVLRGQPHTVVGVMPARFTTSVPADVWTPLKPSRTGEGSGENYTVIGRVREGTTWAEAETRVATVGRAVTLPWRRGAGTTLEMRLYPLQRGLAGSLRQPLLLLWAAVAVVLLIGCANIAGLLLARAGARRPEIATRMALGCGRRGVIRQLFVESLVLAGLGGVAGIAVGQVVVSGLGPLAVQSLDLWQPVRLDWRVFALSLGSALATSVFFGLFPAVEATRLDIRTALGGGARVAGSARHWPRRALLVGEVALAVVLLVGAGLLVRTFIHLQTLDPGFDSRGVVAAKVPLQDARYATAADMNRLVDASLERMRAIPGVSAAAVALNAPYERALNLVFKPVEGAGPDTDWSVTNLCYVSEGYFEALRVPLIQGRGFRREDGAGSVPVVLVNRAFVARFMRGGNPLGRHLAISNAQREVVGVAGDIEVAAGWGDFGPLAAVPTVFMPLRQASDGLIRTAHTWFAPSWIVRAGRGGEALAADVRRAITSVDPMLAVASVRSPDDVRSATLSRERFEAVLLSMLAGLALLLAAVGIFGLVSQSVIERRRELAIRIALGATRAHAIVAAARPGVLLALAGLGTGVVAAKLAGRLVRQQLWGVTQGDPLTFALTVLVLLGVASVASLVPALAIARVSPAQTLRNE